MTARQTVQVCVDLEAPGRPVPMGWLHRQTARSGGVLSFEYERAWLESAEVFALDPDLSLAAGPQYPGAGQASFGIFLDSLPDRWGRVLMQRRERLRARQEGRPARSLSEWDLLLGVQDETRLGALRFRAAPDEPFLAADERLPAPPIASLRDLQAASLAFEAHLDDEEEPAALDRWLTQLFAPGSSLGGARPKASVRDEAGRLCLAKFPSRQDTRDVGAWEAVAHRLAARAGIVVPETRTLRLPGSPHTTFVARRFDRTPRGGRLAFASAMTLTQRRDGEEGASYLELVDVLQTRGAATRADCEQLFRRVLFSILVHNTDDHLRNHGFLIDAQGVRLSPAYDLNPSVDRRDLSLAINEFDTACDPAIAMDACGLYGLKPAVAQTILGEVRAAVGHWRQEAKRMGIPRGEQEALAAAFES